jgi:hypothetical protein
MLFEVRGYTLVLFEFEHTEISTQVRYNISKTVHTTQMYYNRFTVSQDHVSTKTNAEVWNKNNILSTRVCGPWFKT